MNVDLSGNWLFELDENDQGIIEHWFGRQLNGAIQLPGALQAQGFGHEVTPDTVFVGSMFDRSYFTDPRYEPYRQPGNVKLPFWLTPERYYMGPAWYQRQLTIPSHWQNQRVTLSLERPHWETRVWLDEVEIGFDLSLSTPHVYDLGTQLLPGEHRLTIRVDNRMIINVGPNSHSMSDHTQGNWNGIVGRLQLSAGSPVWIENVQVYPNLAHHIARVQVDIGNASGQSGHARLRLAAEAYNGQVPHLPPPLEMEIQLNRSGLTRQIEYQLGDQVQLWDEFSPNLYRLTCRLDTELGGAAYQDQKVVSFGMRQVGVRGTQLVLNGRPLFLRGTLECCIFPRTGYPPADIDPWKRIITICQEHGLNHIRFHSWCPPQAAFEAADELGFTFQVECSSWANQGAAVGEGRPLDRWLFAEGERIVAAYGNHPSFLLMAYGNEPAGRDRQFLGMWVDYWKGRDPRRLHTSGAGWPTIPENQYHSTPKPRIQAWGEGIKSRINALPPETNTDYSDWVAALGAPIVSHEIGQWCVYPDFNEIKKYDGWLKAGNFEIFRDFLQANHMGDQAQDFLMASGKLQALCYKEEIESALRTPGFGGFQLLDLHDFPGQGTALVGLLDPFWDSKPYLTPAEFRRFCGPTIPLARLEKRIWRQSETLTARLDVAHYGPADLDRISLNWRLIDISGRTAAAGWLGPFDLPTGQVTSCGRVTVPLAGLEPAQKYRLVAGLDGHSQKNDWDIWLFADSLAIPRLDNLSVQPEWNEAAQAHLAGGGTLLLMPPAQQISTESQIGFSSVFWNTSWTQGQAPHTLGILCDPQHPLFAHFPTAYHSDWQWWELIHGAAAMNLDHFPPRLRPLIQPIDTWFQARRLGLLFEARVNGGRLVVCSMDLLSQPESRLVARQLWHSLLHYLGSSQFDTLVELAPEAIGKLFTGR